MTITYLNLKMLTFLKYTTDIPRLCKLANCSPGAWDPTETEKLAHTHTCTHTTHTHTHTWLSRLPASLCHVSCTNPGPLPTVDVFNLIIASCHPCHFRLQPGAGTASISLDLSDTFHFLQSPFGESSHHFWISQAVTLTVPPPPSSF